MNDKWCAVATDRSDRWQADTAVLARNTAQLRRIEDRMDALFWQLLVACDEKELSAAADRLDELLLTCPDLRIPRQARYARAAKDLLAHFDLDYGPLPGFDGALEQLCEVCLTPQNLRGLRSVLYTVAAFVSRERPDLLTAVALAAFSIRLPWPSQTRFAQMLLCASAIEWCTTGTPHPLLDVSTWLIAEPGRWLSAAVGEDRARYYAAIPGVLPLLDPDRALFDVRSLAPLDSFRGPRYAYALDALATSSYTRRLRTEIKRVQGDLRRQYPAPSIADIELLTHRALEALDELPVQANPLLQAIYIQSWVSASASTRSTHNGLSIPADEAETRTRRKR